MSTMISRQFTSVYLYGLNNPDDNSWYFCDKNEWGFKKEDGHNKLIHFTRSICRNVNAWRNHFLGALKNNYAEPIVKCNSGTPDYVNWFKKSKEYCKVEGPLSFMLNNVCSSEQVQRFCYIATFAYGNASVELIGLRPGEPCWFTHKYKNEYDPFEELFITFPFHFFDDPEIQYHNDIPRFSENVVELSDLEKKINELKAFRILHECTIENYNIIDSQLKIKINESITLEEYKKGRICYCLPIPGKSLKPDIADKPKTGLINSPEIIVHSPRVVEALNKLSEIWQDRFISSVLITAPPGSGKESFARSIHYGSGRGRKPLSTIALASASQEELERQLFGYKRDDGSICNGVIENSTGGTVFLDEVHHPDDRPGIRASLLRVFENNEYYPIGCTEPSQVKDVLFVLASSRRLSDSMPGSSGKPLSKIDPPDFWTRMSHVVEMDHPLHIYPNDLIEIRETIKSFFKIFWCNRVEKITGIRAFSEKVPNITSTKIKYEQSVDLLGRKSGDDLEEASNIFSDELLEILAKKKLVSTDISIRGIRSMASSLVSRAYISVLSGKKWLGEKDEFKNDCKKVISSILSISILKTKSEK